MRATCQIAIRAWMLTTAASLWSKGGGEEAPHTATRAPGTAAPAKASFTLPLGADIIAAPREPDTRLVDDYAETTYGEKWNFDDGKEARIAEFGPGIRDRRVEDGKLNFTTGGEGAWFFWGDADGKLSKHRQEKSRWNHPHWSPGFLQLRMRQTLPESRWWVTWGRWTELSEPVPRQGSRRDFRVSGTQWQTVQAPLGIRGEHFSSWLSIETSTPGNEVEIDDVRVVRSSERAYFRTEFSLPAAPVFSGIWYVAQPQYVIYVNGQRVHEWEGNGCGWWPAWIDITKHLKSGVNCIAFDRELIDWMGRQSFLIVGGVARCADGHIIRISSRDDWHVNKSPDKGWTQPGFDDSGWGKAKSCGDASKASFPPGVSGIDEMWRACLDMGYQVIPPRHLGAMELSYPNRPDPLFLVNEPVVINVTAPRRLFDGKRYDLSYRLFDSATRTQFEAGRVPERPAVKRNQLWQFKKGGLKQGVYALYLDLSLDDTRSSRSATPGRTDTEDTAFVEFAVCGPVDGEKVKGDTLEEGLKLALVDTIDCGNPDDAHSRVYSEFFGPRPDLPRPRIVENPIAGRVLELNRGFQWAGYRIKFDGATKPYLVRVNYVDSHPQIFGLRIDGPYLRSYSCITACGAYTCRETPPTNTLRQFSTLTWPKERDATLCLINYNSRLPVLVKSVEISRIDNELPQLEIPNPSPGRLFGYATERGTVVLPTFFQNQAGWRFQHHMQNCATTATLRNWWIAGENLIRWLKFTGQNAWCYNAHMYGQIYYPTELSDRYEKSAFQYHMPLLAKMFEANGLSLFAGSEFMSARPIWERDIYTDDEVAEGADTIKAVSFEGRQQLHFAGAGSNYQHPVVENAIVTMVRDLCEPVAAYPAFKGVHFMCGGYFAPSVFKLHRQLDVLKNSYDDTSTRRFAAFAKLKVPDFGRSREKFAQRREWIEKNAKRQWIAWRCAAVTKLVQRCADAATGVRKDLRCVFDWGDWEYGQIKIKRWAEEARYADVAAESGIDYQALRQIPGTVHGQLMEQLGEFEHPNDTMSGAFVAAQQSLEIRGHFDPAAHGVYLHHPFSEGGLETKAGEGWPWDNVASVTYSPRPVGADYLANYTRALSAGAPQMVWHGYCDGQHYSGGEQDLRAVARAYRSIPTGAYHEPPPSVPVKNVLVRLNGDGNSFLVTNPAWWDVDCTVSLVGTRPGITHLNTGKKHIGHSVQVHLAPFAVESFRLENGTRLAAAAGEVLDARASETIHAALAQLQSYRERVEAQGIPVEDAYGRNLLAVTEKLKRCVATGDMGRACHLVNSIEYRRAVTWAQEKAMCNAFLVIGPFDNPKRKFFERPTPVELDILAGKPPEGEYVGKGGERLTWRRTTSRRTGGATGFLDFGELCGQVDEAVAYALVYMHAESDQDVTLLLGSDDSIRAWINGELVVSDFADRSLQPGQTIGHGRLHKGWNTLLFKVDQNWGAWAACIEIVGKQREALKAARFSIAFPER